MKNEPVWMQDIRQKMKKTRFYGQMDEELEQYRQEYLKILDTLDTPRENAIRQYVEQLQKCEYHHIRTAYLLGMEDEKAKQRARKNPDIMSGHGLFQLSSVGECLSDLFPQCHIIMICRIICDGAEFFKIHLSVSEYPLICSDIQYLTHETAGLAVIGD